MIDAVSGGTISGEPPRRALVALGVAIIALPFGLFLLLTYAARGVFALVALLIIAAALIAIVLAVRARRSGAAKRTGSWALASALFALVGAGILFTIFMTVMLSSAIAARTIG